MLYSANKAPRYFTLSIPLTLSICLLFILAWLIGLSDSSATAVAAPKDMAGGLNEPPIANNDIYTTSGDVPLTIPAPGVLANDTDSNGDPLSATLDIAPNNGSLILSSDGAFVYEPTTGFFGVDSFTYIAAEGSAPAQAYWPFEEGSGSTVMDLTSNGLDGTLMNGPIFTTTVPVTPTFSDNYAIQFDGSNDHIETPPINLANHSFSVAFWARRDSADSNHYALGQGTNSNNHGLHIGFRSNNRFTCAFWGNDLNTPDTYTDADWHHWACTYDADSNERAIYLDGTIVATDTASLDYQGSGSFFIGSRFAGANPFDGLLDDVRVYMTPLTEAQVAATLTSNQLALGNRATVTVTIQSGALEGTVTESATGDPIADATVIATFDPGAIFMDTTEAVGAYNITLPAATYSVTASAFGYETTYLSGVSVPPDMTTTLNFTLDVAMTYVVEGVVTDALTGWPLYASIDIDGYPGDPIWTNPETGYYSITLPTDTAYTFNVAAWVGGYLDESRPVGPITGHTTEDFALYADGGSCTAPGYEVTGTTLLVTEDFDSGITASWQVTDNSGGAGCVWRDDDPGSRGNNTGGTGIFAIIDTDQCGSSTNSNTELITPQFDASAFSGLVIEYKTDYNDLGSISNVDVSADGGANWTTVQAIGGADVSGPSTQIVYAGVDLGSSAAQVRWRHIAGWDWWWEVDEVRVYGQSCTPTAGGLVVGNVYDDNIGGAVNGADVENTSGEMTLSMATPDDPAIDDGFYTLFSPVGSQTFTASLISSGYGPDVQTPTVLVSDTIRQDFNLPAGWLDTIPDSLAVTLDIGLSTTLPLTLSNIGNLSSTFTLADTSTGFTPSLLRSVMIPAYQPPLAKAGESLAGQAPLAQQSKAHESWLYTPSGRAFMTGNTPNVLLFASDDVSTIQTMLSAYPDLGVVDYYNARNGTPTLAELLGYDTVVVLSNFGFNNNVAAGDVIADYIDAGGTVVQTNGSFNGTATWALRGRYFSDGYSPYEYSSNLFFSTVNLGTYDASHPIMAGVTSATDNLLHNLLVIKPEATFIADWSDGQGLAATLGSVVGLNIFVSNSGNWSGDIDLMLHNSIIWLNQKDAPWLSEELITGTVAVMGNTAVTVTFDASAVSQPGEYYANIVVDDDTPYDPIIPVSMTVNAPFSWGKIAGTLSLFDYCAINATPSGYREILIEASNGFTATTTTDENGSYQWWLDASASPLTITVGSIAEYENGLAAGVNITAGMTTIQDFDLRRLEPCVSVEPNAYEKVLFLGDVLTDSLDLHNDGAVSTTFAITETNNLAWLSQAPVTGTVDVDSLETIDIVFDSSVLTQTGWYSGAIQVDSDDPVTSTILVPVDMIVVSGTTGVDIGPDSTQTSLPGTMVSYTFTVANSGKVMDIYDLTLSGNNWSTTLPPINTSFMAPGETFTFTIAVHIPHDPTRLNAIIGSDVFTVTATSQLDGVMAVATGTTLAEVGTAVLLDGDQNGSGFVGETVTYNLHVTNTGEFTDTFDLSTSNNNWATELSVTSLTLRSGESANVAVTVTIASGEETDVATVIAISQLDNLTSDSVTLSTTGLFRYIYLPLLVKR